MAITRNIKTPRGYDDQVLVPILHQISEGQTPPLAHFRPAPYLPTIKIDKRVNEYFVIRQGTIVSLQDDHIVPANGGTAQDITYQTQDIDEVVDQSTFSAGTTPAAGVNEMVDTARVSAGAISGALAANKPIGFVPFEIYNYGKNYPYSTKQWVNYSLQEQITLLCDYYCEMALTLTAQNNLVAGDLLVPNGDGVPVRFADLTPGTVAALQDDVEQICGRVLRVFDNEARGGLDKTLAVSGSGVAAGNTTGGLMKHQYRTHSGTGDTATKIMRFQITLI